MGMYLRVNIPYRYALPKSPTDYAIVDVFPLMEPHSPYGDHITLSLESLQVPWAQINKKNEVFTFDPQTSFFPAYNSTSKIRPKMLPKSVPLVKTILNDLTSQFDSNPEHPLPMVRDSTYADHEKRYQAGRNKEMRGLYEAYKPFFHTKLFSVRRFMDWAAIQSDLVGIWNQGQISSQLLHQTTQKTYRLANKNEDGTTPSFHYLRDSSHSEKDYEVEPEHLGISYSQKVLGIAPYTSHPSFGQVIPRPVSFRYRFVSEMAAQKNTLKHPDASVSSDAKFSPPSIDWVGAGFPEIAASTTKTMYGRDPVQVNSSYVERGFTKKVKTLIQRCLEEWNAPEIWFSNLAEPVNTNGDYVPVYRSVEGNIVGLSALSWMERSYLDTSEDTETTERRGKIVWKQQSYDSLGYGIHYKFISDGSSWRGKPSRQQNFHSGPISRNFRWDDIPTNLHTRQNTSTWSWNKAQGLHRSIGSGTVKGRQAREAGYQPDLPSRSFEDEVIYLGCDYEMKTRQYSKGLARRGETWGVMKDRKNAGIMVLQENMRSFRQNDKGREILGDLLNSGICLSAYLSESEKGSVDRKRKGADLPKIQSFLEQVLVHRPTDFEVKMESWGAVSVTQKTTRRNLLKTIGQLQPHYRDDVEWSAKAQLRLENGEKKGQQWAYKVYFLKHSDDCGFSVLKTLPSFLSHPPKKMSSLFAFTSHTLLTPQTIPGFITIEPSRFQEQQRLPFKVFGKKGTVPIPLVGEEVLDYLNTTAYGGYQYSLIHVRDGVTLSDPVNTLPLDYKRGKVSLTRPFTYTSLIPVIGEKGTTSTPIKIPDTNQFNRNRILNSAESDYCEIEFSPVNRYQVSVSESATQLSIPTYLFKAQNTNSRMFKPRRRLDGYGVTTKPNDYRIYSQFIFPFGDFTYMCMDFGPGQSRYGNFDTLMRDFAANRAKNPQTAALKVPVSNQSIQKSASSSKRYGKIPFNLGSWNLGVPTTVVPETYSLVGRELGIANWISLL